MARREMAAVEICICKIILKSDPVITLTHDSIVQRINGRNSREYGGRKGR